MNWPLRCGRRLNVVLAPSVAELDDDVVDGRRESGIADQGRMQRVSLLIAVISLRECDDGVRFGPDNGVDRIDGGR